MGPGSTHGLGWVGFDWVEMFFLIFGGLCWVVSPKRQKPKNRKF